MPLKKIRQRSFVFFVVFCCFFHCQLHAWSAPQTVSLTASSINAIRSPVAMNSNSQAVVGWLDGPITVGSNLYSSDFDPITSTWTAPNLIYAGAGPGFPTFPVVFVDDGNNETAGFSELNPFAGTTTISVARKPSGAPSWSSPISEVLAGLTAGGGVSSDPSGNLLAILALTPTFTPPVTITTLALSSTSSSWTSPIVLATDSSAQPAVNSATANGQAILTWKTDTPSLALQAALYNFSTNTLTPTADVVLPPGTTDILRIEASIDSHGNAIIFANLTVSGTDLAYTTTLMLGDLTWSVPQLISNIANNAAITSVQMDMNGNSVLMWSEKPSPTQEFLIAADLPLGGTATNFTDLTSSATPNTTIDPTAMIVVDSFGNALATWAISTGGPYMVQVATKPVQGVWSSATTLSPDGNTPKGALSSQGAGVVVWIDGATGMVMASTDNKLFPAAAPASFVGFLRANRFATQTEYFIDMLWTPSPASNVIDYRIYKNNNLLAAISSGKLGFYRERQVPKHVSAAYSLVAITSNGNESLPVTMQLFEKK